MRFIAKKRCFFETSIHFLRQRQSHNKTDASIGAIFAMRRAAVPNGDGFNEGQAQAA